MDNLDQQLNIVMDYLDNLLKDTGCFYRFNDKASFILCSPTGAERAEWTLEQIIKMQSEPERADPSDLSGGRI